MAKVDANKALNVGKDGYQKGGITFKAPLGQPTKNKVKGQRAMLASKKSEFYRIAPSHVTPHNCRGSHNA